MASATMRTCARVNQLSRTNAPVARRVQRQQARSVSAAAHNICVLPGDGIGPEIMAVAVDLLHAAGKKECVEFEMSEHLIGGAGIDGAGSPYPQATEDACKASDAVLLAAIGGCAPDTLCTGCEACAALYTDHGLAQWSAQSYEPSSLPDWNGNSMHPR